jgi:hypothetical protein
MTFQKKFVAAALMIIAVMMITTVVAILQTSKTIPSSGTIYAYKLGIYSDSGCNTPISTINWATVNPGGSTQQVIYVKNEAGNLKMELSMETPGWSPTPSNSTAVVFLGWDKTATKLDPNTSTMATVSLVVADNAETQAGLTFDVSIKIVGTETT